MATDAQRRTWRNAVDDALTERDGADRYERRQREVRRGRTAPSGRPGPMQFDARGFPIPQPIPGFVQRVGRLIKAPEG
jgi:hypothetical protein